MAGAGATKLNKKGAGMKKKIILCVLLLTILLVPSALAYYDHGGSNGMVPTYLVYYDHGGSNG